MKWTARDMPDQTGKRIVITGANSGIGWQAATEMVRKGAAVVMACRSKERGQAALDKIRELVPTADVTLELIDLADLATVREFAARFRRKHDSLDVLLNNAGVMAFPDRRVSADGFEAQFATNHLGHFALTMLLAPALVGRPGARVVTVSSIAHKGGRFDWDDLQTERPYSANKAYSQSKLANLSFALHLQRRLTAMGSPAISVAAHPGVAATNLFAAGPGSGRGPVVIGALRLAGKLMASEAEGALPLLYGATAPGVVGGQYFGPDWPGEFRGHPTLVKPNRAALDESSAERLWHVSERLTGTTFPKS